MVEVDVVDVEVTVAIYRCERLVWPSDLGLFLRTSVVVSTVVAVTVVC